VEPKPAKYFVAFLLADPTLRSAVEAEIVSALGAIDGRSAMSEWQQSKYYAAEMGAKLWRGFLSFKALHGADQLAAIKLQTRVIENKFRDTVSSGRRVNLDPGYLDTLKVVLASTKNAKQRVYLNSGIYAEAALVYHHGEFHGQAYTYPDYRTPQALEFFEQTRSIYVEQLRQSAIRSSQP